MTIYQTNQQLEPGAIISLFRLDMRKVGGGIFHFVQGKEVDRSTGVRFDGVEYTPADIEFEGLELTGQGAFPTPVVRVSNTDGLIQSAINTWGDLLGCELRRMRTYKKFLDGEPSADPTAYYGADVFTIERKTDENPVYVEWELSAQIDQEGKKLPGRVVVRNTCLWRYRAFDKQRGVFDYTGVKCPYAGNAYYDRSNQPTTADKDRCSRSLDGCKLRFGEDNPLPFGGFPGAGRVRGL